MGEKLSTTAVLGIVAEYASGLDLELSPHALHRTCARLCRVSGGALEQIQFLLGHASVQTTERYLAGEAGSSGGRERQASLGLGSAQRHQAGRHVDRYVTPENEFVTGARRVRAKRAQLLVPWQQKTLD